MAPDINDPGGQKNDPDEIRDGVVSDATRFPGGFIDEKITESGAAVQIVGQFQLNNASFVRPFDVSSQDSNPRGLVFKPDGSQLYVVGGSNANLNQYGLSTAFDVSTASFVRSFDISPQDTSPRGLALNPDGSQVYVVGNFNTNIIEYDLSSAFDISTASFVQSFDVSSQDNDPKGLALNPDGSQVYLVGASTDNVYQYSLSTAFDISTASLVQSFGVNSQDSLPEGLAFKPDGSQLYLAGNSNGNVYQYRLSTAFDISTASFVRSLDVSPQDSGPRGLVFKPDGSQLYVSATSNVNVYQYAVGFVGSKLG